MTTAQRFATLALLVFPAACNPISDGSDSHPIEAATIKKRDPARVRVEPVVRREMLRILETTTRVESEQQVEVMARSSGLVVEVLVEEGDRVVRGQVFARLDTRELAIAAADAEVALDEARAAEPRLELAVREAQARLTVSERSHGQAQRDYDRNVAISQPSPDRPALLSPKDLEASRLARDNAEGEVRNSALALERVQLDQGNAKTALQRAELTLERARLNLANMSITAPFDGVLAARNINVGDTISGSTSAFRLTNPERLRAVFYRPQRELGLFTGTGGSTQLAANGASEGAVAAEVGLFASAEALPGRRFGGTILRIAPTIDAQSGNFRVTAQLNQAAEGTPHAQLLPGMLVRLEIITERHPDALVIPKRALRREGDTTTVFVVRENRAVRVAVAEVLSDDESVEVRVVGDGRLEPGDSVIVVGNRDLEDGVEVTVADASEPVPQAVPAAEHAQDGAALDENKAPPLPEPGPEVQPPAPSEGAPSTARSDAPPAGGDVQ